MDRKEKPILFFEGGSLFFALLSCYEGPGRQKMRVARDKQLTSSDFFTHDII